MIISSEGHKWSFDVEEWKFLDNWMRDRENAIFYGKREDEQMSFDQVINAISVLTELLKTDSLSYSVQEKAEQKLSKLIDMLNV